MNKNLLIIAVILLIGFAPVWGQESQEDLERRKVEKMIATVQEYPEAAGRMEPEQDCNSAIAVCQDTYVQSASFSGFGDMQEVPLSSCLGSGERNSVWYIFTVNRGGTLEFTIDPNTDTDDYDFALYNLTGRNCFDIMSGAAPEVRCNYCVDAGSTGLSPEGVNPSEDCCSNSPGCGFSSILEVAVGETYVLVVSNFTSSNDGYTLSFGGTAEILDEIPSAPIFIFPLCDSTAVGLFMSEAILCSSISEDGSEFTLTGPGGPFTIEGVTGINCGTATPYLLVEVSPPMIEDSVYILTVNSGTDGNTLIDNCGNATDEGTALTFLGIGPDDSASEPLSVVSPCSTPSIGLQMTEPVRCASISADGSEFTLTGPGGPFTISGATGIDCGFSTTQLILDVTPQLFNGSDYILTITTGTDGNTLIDNCGNPTEDGISLPFTAVAPSAEITGPKNICLGSSTTLTATVGASYSWSTGDTTQVITVSPTEETSYSVTVTTGTCSQSATALITVLPLPEITISDDVTISPGESAPLTASGGTSYQWDPTDGLDNPTSNTPVSSPDQTTQYTVAVTGANGCVNSESVTVNVVDDCLVGNIFIPNAFSPNGDGLNDLFRIQISGNFDRYELIIQDRWGNEVFRSADASEGWDGTFNGKALSGDSFGYLVRVFCDGEGVTRKGSITLIK